jgi:outer membrane protein assembly factor BamB
VPPIEKIGIHASAAVVPTKIGSGGLVYIVGWINPPRELFGGFYPNLTFTITKPNGSTDTRVHYSDSAATYSFSYVCDQEGTWSVKLTYAGDYFHESAASESATWIVEAGYVVPTYPSEPLPTDYWEYPISAEYYEWYQISGAWTQYGYNKSEVNFNPFTKGPNTPHVLWKREMQMMGLIGGEEGYLSLNAITGSQSGINRIFPNFVAAQGKFWYTTSEGTGSNLHPVLWCLDQSTGEVIYRYDVPCDPNSPGGGGTLVLEQKGNYKTDPKLGFAPNAFSLWIIGGGIWEIDPYTLQMYYYWPGQRGTFHDGNIYLSNYPTFGVVSKWSCRRHDIAWTKPMPSPRYYWKDILVMYDSPTGAFPFGCRITTYNATTGDLIAQGPAYPYASSDIRIVAYGKFYIHCTDRITRALSLYTGQEVWASEPMSYPWGAFSAYAASAGYDKVYIPSYDGHLYAYDAETGALKWKAFTENTTETAEGTYPIWCRPVVADGKVYFCTSEHTFPNPVPRGNALYCVDANTGERLWKIPFLSDPALFAGTVGISSGMLWYNNMYDGCVYMFGKGLSATTVSVQQDVVAKGVSVLIKGTVTDQSAGAKDTPAIADEDQSEWMEYLYMNKPMPTDITGVPVLLQAMRSDGTVFEIGWATSDIMGHYEYLWTPPDQDTYKILATFGGSESYYMSSAQTAVGVTAAPATSEFPDVPTAAEIAQATINRLPPYPTMPTVPTAAEVAQETINRLPPYPTMPDVPTAAEVAAETEQVLDIAETPAFLTIDLVILVVAAIGVVIGLLAYMTLRKQ